MQEYQSDITVKGIISCAISNDKKGGITLLFFRNMDMRRRRKNNQNNIKQHYLLNK